MGKERDRQYGKVSFISHSIGPKQNLTKAQRPVKSLFIETLGKKNYPSLTSRRVNLGEK